MTEREKLLLHLQTLAKNNTLDVNFLLGVLNALPKEQPKPVSSRLDKTGVDVDGGSFRDTN